MEMNSTRTRKIPHDSTVCIENIKICDKTGNCKNVKVVKALGKVKNKIN